MTNVRLQWHLTERVSLKVAPTRSYQRPRAKRIGPDRAGPNRKKCEPWISDQRLKEVASELFPCGSAAMMCLLWPIPVLPEEQEAWAVS